MGEQTEPMTDPVENAAQQTVTEQSPTALSDPAKESALQESLKQQRESVALAKKNITQIREKLQAEMGAVADDQTAPVSESLQEEGGITEPAVDQTTEQQRNTPENVLLRQIPMDGDLESKKIALREFIEKNEKSEELEAVFELVGIDEERLLDLLDEEDFANLDEETQNKQINKINLLIRYINLAHSSDLEDRKKFRRILNRGFEKQRARKDRIIDAILSSETPASIEEVAFQSDHEEAQKIKKALGKTFNLTQLHNIDTAVAEAQSSASADSEKKKQKVKDAFARAAGRELEKTLKREVTSQGEDALSEKIQEIFRKAEQASDGDTGMYMMNVLGGVKSIKETLEATKSIQNSRVRQRVLESLGLTSAESGELDNADLTPDEVSSFKQALWVSVQEFFHNGLQSSSWSRFVDGLFGIYGSGGFDFSNVSNYSYESEDGKTEVSFEVFRNDIKEKPGKAAQSLLNCIGDQGESRGLRYVGMNVDSDRFKKPLEDAITSERTGDKNLALANFKIALQFLVDQLSTNQGQDILTVFRKRFAQNMFGENSAIQGDEAKKIVELLTENKKSGKSLRPHTELWQSAWPTEATTNTTDTQ